MSYAAAQHFSGLTTWCVPTDYFSHRICAEVVYSPLRRDLLETTARSKRGVSAECDLGRADLTGMPSSTNTASPETCTIKRCAPSATASSASCTDACATARPMTNTPPGHTVKPPKRLKVQPWDVYTRRRRRETVTPPAGSVTLTNRSAPPLAAHRGDRRAGQAIVRPLNGGRARRCSFAQLRARVGVKISARAPL